MRQLSTFCTPCAEPAGWEADGNAADGRRTRKLGNALRPPNAEFALRDPTAGLDVKLPMQIATVNGTSGNGRGRRPLSSGL